MHTFAEAMTRHSRPTRKSGAAITFNQALAAQQHPAPKAATFSSIIAGREAQRSPGAEAAALTLVKATINDEQRVVRGWASVATVGGKPVIDLQNDLIDIEELRKAARDFLTGSRASLHSHAGEPIGEVVESLVLDADMQKALGVDLGMEGWLIGIRVADDAAWAEVRKGSLMSFSIGGWAVREE